MKDAENSPDIERLVRCARELAALIPREPEPDAIIRAGMEDLLFHRRNWAAVRVGIMTNDEIVNLVLAHMHTILIGPGAIPPGEPWRSAEVRACVERALFGDAPAL